MGQPHEIIKGEDGTESVSDGRSRILLHCPDITLKGRNQNDFKRRLLKNTRERLVQAGRDWHVGAARGRMLVDIPHHAEKEIPRILSILQRMPGISSLASTRWLRSSDLSLNGGAFNWPFAEAEIVKLAREWYVPDASFAIRVNRADKKLPVNSVQLGKRLGEVIRRDTPWEKVNLNHPDQIFYIDIYPDGFYMYAEKLKGVGGLPSGSGGRVLVLLSGGIDSPVAAFMLAKRGCSVDFFHLSASHMRTDELEQSVIGRLARRLSEYTGHSRLFVAPYTYFDLSLAGRHSGYELILFRRFMMRAAEELAGRIHALALVNGDSLGQVASQTLENLVSASLAVNIPILRPLIGTNKEEIIDVARRIDTFNISIEPYKDCCALIARDPRTRSRHEDMSVMEQEVLPDYDLVLERTLADMHCLKYRFGERTDDREKD